jgi:hypothetical protein
VVGELVLGYFTVRSLSCTSPIYPVFKEQLTGILHHANTRFGYCQPTFISPLFLGYTLHKIEEGVFCRKKIKSLMVILEIIELLRQGKEK